MYVQLLLKLTSAMEWMAKLLKNTHTSTSAACTRNSDAKGDNSSKHSKLKGKKYQ